MTMLAGTVMCLGIDIWRRTGSRPAFMAAWVAAGFGLWVQQYILYYWIALALAILHWLSATRRGSSGTACRARSAGVAAPADRGARAVGRWRYVGLGVVAFLTGGFDAAPFGVPHRRAPRAEALEHRGWHCCSSPRAARVVSTCETPGRTGIVAGLCGRGRLRRRIRAGAGRATRGRRIAADRARPTSPGCRRPSRPSSGKSCRSCSDSGVPRLAWLGVPFWLGLAIVLAIVASFVALRERPFTPLFHFLLVAAPPIFLVERRVRRRAVVSLSDAGIRGAGGRARPGHLAASFSEAVSPGR